MTETSKNLKTETPINAKVRIRMYRQGLGDCFLLTFYNETDSKEVHMLIDCGSIGKGLTGKDMKDIILDIHNTTSGKIDVLVVTHEHQDHVSGFNVTDNGSNLFKKLFTVDNVWMAWTEDSDSMSKGLDAPNKELLDKTKIGTRDWWNSAKGLLSPFLKQIQEEAEKALAEAKKKLEEAKDKGNAKELEKAKKNLEKVEKNMYTNLMASYEIADLLDVGDFAGISGTVDDAMDTAKKIGTKKKFLEPGDVIEPGNLIDVINDKELIPGWRFYVLGPPKDIKQLGETGEGGNVNLYHFAESQIGDLTAVIKFFCSDMSLDKYREELKTHPPEERQKFNAWFPFDDRFRKEIGDLNGSKPVNDDTYRRYFQDSVWQRIDYDWLVGPAESLALQMDNYTNNTSLVLAMEHMESERVLLFPGDAQLGNWQTWDGTEGKDPVKFEIKDGNKSRTLNSVDLLKRTAFYKVGHHGSHNATTMAGLKLMGEGEFKDSLVAMISVESSVAYKKGSKGWVMPAHKLYENLLKYTHGRVFRADEGWPNIINNPPEADKQQPNDDLKKYKEKKKAWDDNWSAWNKDGNMGIIVKAYTDEIKKQKNDFKDKIKITDMFVEYLFTPRPNSPK